MRTIGELAVALARAWPELAGRDDEAQKLAREAERQLARWGHGREHELFLERASGFGEPPVLRCLFWCETCHVSQLVVLDMPSVR